MAAVLASQPRIEHRYVPHGAALALGASQTPEVCLVGAAGTGKSLACLHTLHLTLRQNPGARGLMVRKTRRSLTESAMVTYEQKVLAPGVMGSSVEWQAAKQRYAYSNGSILAVGGLDKPGKVMSSEWDIIYVQEATELNEVDWEALTTRLRNGHIGKRYQQLIADCNPDAPTHWLRRRMDAGKTLELVSVHEDNPVLWDGANWTAEGTRYIATLEALTGVRYLRLRKGFWSAAEGMVYQDVWDRERNLIDRRAVETRNERTGKWELPRSWPRYLSIDFGFNHPFVCQWWARDPDGRLYLYREIYMTNRLIQTLAQDILNAAGWTVAGGRMSAPRPDSDPLPYQVIADPEDAEGRAQLARYLGCAITPAHKEVRQGIQAVAARMRLAGDNKPRLMLLRDSLVERDPLLVERRAPTCTAEEVESYVWRRGPDGQPLEEPLKAHDDGLDAARYVVAGIDLHPMGVEVGPNIWG